MIDELLYHFKNNLEYKIVDLKKILDVAEEVDYRLHIKQKFILDLIILQHKYNNDMPVIVVTGQLDNLASDILFTYNIEDLEYKIIKVDIDDTLKIYDKKGEIE